MAPTGRGSRSTNQDAQGARSAVDPAAPGILCRGVGPVGNPTVLDGGPGMRPSIRPHDDAELVRRAVAHPPTMIAINRIIKQLRTQFVRPGLEECLEGAAGVEGAAPGLVCAFFAYSGPNPLVEGVGA